MKFFQLIALLILFTLPADLMGQSLTGSWKIEGADPEGNAFIIKAQMTEDGTYSLDWGNDGKVEVKGTFTVEGDQVTIQDTEGNECKGKGVYRWPLPTTN